MFVQKRLATSLSLISNTVSDLSWNILFEDNHIIADYKPPGLLIHGDRTNDETLCDKINNYLVRKSNKQGSAYVGVIHRLDRPASGLLVFGKTSKATSRMSKLFQAGNVKKSYFVLVEGSIIKPGCCFYENQNNSFVVPYENQNNSFVVPEPSNTILENIALYYRPIVTTAIYPPNENRTNVVTTLIDVDLISGRKHQIRIQFSKMGHPILRDVKYGAAYLPNSIKNINFQHNDTSTKILNNESQIPNHMIALHSYRLQFEHPIKKEALDILCPPPFALWKHHSLINQNIMDSIYYETSKFYIISK